MKRYFNTSGPNRPYEHYTLIRPDLMEIGKDLVNRERYFTIWAPRQTGKSTYFMLLKVELEKEGYQVVWMNIENYQGASLRGFLDKLIWEFGKIGLKMPKFKSLDDFSLFLAKLNDQKIVCIIDEIEGLNPQLFGQFLHSIRNLYHDRDKHALKSVILVGVSNIVGVVEDHASPFNIADNVNVPFFSSKETVELLEQHEKETGQLFEPKVKTKIREITANQPGLVNGFAYELVKRNKDKALINFADYVAVEDWYIRKAIDKNIANVTNKAKQHRSFVESLLFLELKIPFNIHRPEIKFLYTNGLIDEGEDGTVVFKVPLYKKCLYHSFYPYMNGENIRIRQELWTPEYFDKDDSLNFQKLIANYKDYINRRGFRYFREKDPTDPKRKRYLSLKEAALVYSFETYIQAFLQEAGGRSYLEPHAGLGRIDLFLFIKRKVYVLEFKVYGGPSKFEKGKKQLAYYCRKEGLKKGVYVVFVPNHIRLPQVVQEATDEMVDNVAVTTFLVMYDEEKDF